MKKFKDMTLKEKIASMRGYAIHTDEELSGWSKEDRVFYYYRINDQTDDLLSLLIPLGKILCLILFALFLVRII